MGRTRLRHSLLRAKPPSRTPRRPSRTRSPSSSPSTSPSCRRRTMLSPPPRLPAWAWPSPCLLPKRKERTRLLCRRCHLAFFGRVFVPTTHDVHRLNWHLPVSLGLNFRFAHCSNVSLHAGGVSRAYLPTWLSFSGLCIRA